MVTYNGKSFLDVVKVLDIRRSILPPQTLSTKSIEGRDGSIFYRKSSDSLEIEIDLIIVGDSPENLRANIRQFATIIDAPEPKPLILPDEPDKYINAIISGDTGLETLYRAGQGTITMFAPDPYFYAINDDIFENTETGRYSFSRKGNTVSFPDIEIEGSNLNGEITVETDFSEMTFDGELNVGETLVLDSELLTAKVVETDGNVRSAIPYLDKLDFPVLQPGTNHISITTKGDASLDNYRVKSNSRWK